MHDDAIASRDARCNLSLLAGLMADFDPGALGAVLNNPIDGPSLTVAKQGARWDLEHIPPLPDHNANLDAIRVAECGAGPSRIREIEDDVDALLLDTQRRDLREPGGLDAPDGGLKAVVAAPLLDDGPRPGFHTDGVRREKVGDDFQLHRVTDFQQRVAGRHHRFALTDPL